MPKANYMYGQEANASIKANEREPYWDYMARRGAGKSSEVYPVREDMVNHPSHYNKGIETSEYIKSWEMNWNQANVVKYITRYNLRSKDINIQIQDLMKAKWYLEDLIKELEKHNPY